MDTVSQLISQPRMKRRYRSAEERRCIVEKTLVPGTSVAIVARAHGVNANQVFGWHADAYAGFNQLYENGSIQPAPCLAHIRRRFYDLMEAHHSPIADEAVERIAALHAIEKQIRGRPPDERRQIRNSRARPLLESMRTWLETSLSKLARKSDTTAAIHYALARWDAFVRYCDDGRIEIDNSAAERALRAVALGRKNYLFAGSDRGGDRAATFYSLIGTAKLNGLTPEAYLRYVLEHIANHPITRIQELLPWNIAVPTASQPAA